MMYQGNFTHDLVEDIEKLESVQDDSGRFYNTPYGKMASVTTVTGWEKQKFFAKWRKENPKESRRVCSRGNYLHNAIEQYLLNNEVTEDQLPGGSKYLFAQMKESLDKIDNIRALEASLWSKSTTLAGRVDCVGEYDGELSIIDFKGATRKKRIRDIDNYFMQATAYAIAWQERVEQPVNQIVILIAAEDGANQVFKSTPQLHTKSLLEAIKKYNEHFAQQQGQLW
jgi:ATP-dependent exoDNAse (exonuclease V) beta subunit|tara:strand:- start:104 stop:781 length:678 start_codon:yes stop_codon:yes gene_type:complete